MKMLNNKLTARTILILSVIILCLISIKGFSDDSRPKDAVPMITAVEGNIIYYAEVGDTVKKGEPLFFVRANDFPLEKIVQLRKNIVYFKKTYDRKKSLAKTHSLSVQEMDDAWHDYFDTLNELAIAEQQTRTGFYVAPFDCEIISRQVPATSGIADGEPAVFIKEIK